jgi:hypothetical protein
LELNPAVLEVTKPEAAEETLALLDVRARAVVEAAPQALASTEFYKSSRLAVVAVAVAEDIVLAPLDHLDLLVLARVLLYPAARAYRIQLMARAAVAVAAV